MPKNRNNLTDTIGVASLFPSPTTAQSDMAPSAAGKREPSIEAKFAAKRKAWAENPAILSTSHTIHLGDARQMPELGSEPAVQLVVTSPPYFNLIEYPDRPGRDQLGNFGEYSIFLAE